MSVLITCSCNKKKAKKFNPKATIAVFTNKETMPVWVHGNENSGYIILAVHGGPGSNVLDFRNYKCGKGFLSLETDYQVAYWQQRASGQSVGRNKKSLFTIETYVNDCDAVVNELKSKYPGKEIILFGHSWGGMLTAAYLNDNTRRAKIKGWIDAAGAHNGTIFHQTTIDDINGEADARISANENTNYWEGIKEGLIADPNQANSIAYAVVNEIPEVTVKINNAEDFEFTKRAIKSNRQLFTEIVESNYTSSLSSFNLPVLLLWGEYDFAVSKTLRQEVIDNIGTDDLTSITFNASGHYMMFHEPVLFANSIKDFIEGL